MSLRHCADSIPPHHGLARSLTPRQSEVLDPLHQGLTNKVIARRLGLSDTVRRHVQDILQFLEVARRAEAAFFARQQGLVGCSPARASTSRS